MIVLSVAKLGELEYATPSKNHQRPIVFVAFWEGGTYIPGFLRIRASKRGDSHVKKVNYANQTRILGCGEHNSRDGGPCGLRHGGDATGNGRRQTCGKAEAAPATPAEPVDVLFVPNGSFMFQEEGHVSGGLVAAFGEEFPNVNLIVEPYSGNRNEAFAAAAAANIPYDVVTGGEGTPIDRGLQGTVLHLNDYIKATGLDMGDVWEGLLEPVVWRDGRVIRNALRPGHARALYEYRPLCQRRPGPGYGAANVGRL